MTPAPADTPLRPRLWTYDFTVLTVAATFGFCNIAIFYGFASYLERIGVPPAWRGMLLGAEPLAAFACRPFLSVWVTPRNALVLARLSLAGLGLALAAYPFAQGIPGLLAVRVFHGLSFVCLVSAVMTLLSRVIDPAVSGRAFGYFSLSALVPYAVMPPLTEWLLPRVGGEDRAYAYAALLVLPSLALLAPLSRRFGRGAAMPPEASRRPSFAAIRENLSQGPVALVLAANLCVFLCTTLVFFYIKPFAVGIGLAEPGLFFTLSTGASMAVRVLAGRLYDRLPKPPVLAAALVALAGCMLLFAGTAGEARFLVLAACYGLCLGVAMPLVNAVMFGQTPPHLRGLNMNLMLFTMDAGYVFGPLAGGALLAAGAGYPVLFGVSAAFAVAAAVLVLPLAVGARTGSAAREKT